MYFSWSRQRLLFLLTDKHNSFFPHYLKLIITSLRSSYRRAQNKQDYHKLHQIIRNYDYI